MKINNIFYGVCTFNSKVSHLVFIVDFINFECLVNIKGNLQMCVKLLKKTIKFIACKKRPKLDFHQMSGFSDRYDHRKYPFDKNF